MPEQYTTHHEYQKFWNYRAAMYPHRAFGTNDPNEVSKMTAEHFISISVVLSGKRTRLWGFESASDLDLFLRSTPNSEVAAC